MSFGAPPPPDRYASVPRLPGIDVATFRPSAVIFDLDGTVLDNMALHAEAFGVFAQRHGLPPLTPDDRARLDGKRNSEIFPVIFGRPLAEGEWRAYEDEKESLYREISRGRLHPLPGFGRLLECLAAHDVATAIATSAPGPNVEHTLRETGLVHLAPRVVRGDQVPRGKPAPDVFLAAADLAGVAPHLCLAFEDAPAGIASAHAAGMACVGLTTSFPATTLASCIPPPDLSVADYDEFLADAGAWLTSRGERRV